MRVPMTIMAVATCGLVASGCSTFNDYASACERDYARNRERATASGALLGAAIRFSGMPHRPNPPAMTVMPSKVTPSSADRASGKIFRIASSFISPCDEYRRPSCSIR